MGKHRWVGVALLLLASSLIGCGRAGDQSSPGGTVSASQPPADSGPSFFPTATPTSTGATSGATAGATATGGTGSVTVRGQVEPGVEPGCVLLKAEDGHAYLLVGGDRAVIGAGGRLEAIGQPKPDLMTTCQQGTPFQVEQVRQI